MWCRRRNAAMTAEIGNEAPNANRRTQQACGFSLLRRLIGAATTAAIFRIAFSVAA